MLWHGHDDYAQPAGEAWMCADAEPAGADERGVQPGARKAKGVASKACSPHAGPQPSIALESSDHFPPTPVDVTALNACSANGNEQTPCATRRLLPGTRTTEPRDDLRKLHSVMFSVEEVLASQVDPSVDFKLPSVKPCLQVVAAYAMLSVRISPPSCTCLQPACIHLLHMLFS
jgi:hypothetical protein